MRGLILMAVLMTLLLFAAAFSLVLAVLSRRPDLQARASSWVAHGGLGVLLGVGVALLVGILGLIDDELLPLLLVVLLSVGLLVAWVRSFTWLMRLPDDVFPGRHDKLIWALLLIVLPPVGVVAFWSFRRAHLPEEEYRKPEPLAAREWF